MIEIIKKEKVKQIVNKMSFMIFSILVFVKPATEITGKLDNVIDIIKAIFCIAIFIMYISYKKPSRLICLISTIQILFLVSTAISSNGRIMWQLVQLGSIVSIMMLTEMGLEINAEKTIKSFAIGCGIMLIATLLSMFITYPNGVYQVKYDNYIEKNNFLWGFDNASIFKVLPTIMFFMVLSINDKKKVVLTSILLLLVLIAFMYVESITAVIVLFVLFVYYILINCCKLKGLYKIINFRNLFIGIILVFLVLLIFNMNNALLNKLATFTEKTGSLQYRFSVWDSTINAIKDRFLLGYGYSDTQVEIERIKIDHPHNIFLDITYRGGIISMLIFIYVMININKKLMDNKENILGQVLSITLILILLSGQMDYYNDQYLIFVLYIFIDSIEKIKEQLLKNNKLQIIKRKEMNEDE